MEDMARRYADQAVRSVFIYSREAHPGEKYRHHGTMDEKRRGARALREELKLKRRILLDDVQGTAHHAYGLLPNMTWIIGRGGIVHYKAAWTNTQDIEDALKDIIDGLNRRVKGKLMPFYSERLSWRVRDDDTFKSLLERVGPQAVTDFYGKDAAE
jgi:hypothetical protein